MEGSQLTGRRWDDLLTGSHSDPILPTSFPGEVRHSWIHLLVASSVAPLDGRQKLAEPKYPG